MSTSSFARISAALVSAIEAAPALAGVPVWADRSRPLPAANAVGVVVRLLGANANQAPIGHMDWTTEFAVEVYVRSAASGANPTASADPYLCAAWTAVQSISPANLSSIGVMALDAVASIDWQVDETDAPSAMAAFRVLVRHITPTTTLEPAP